MSNGQIVSLIIMLLCVAATMFAWGYSKGYERAQQLSRKSGP